MRALVVFDTTYGSTARIARAIGEALEAATRTSVDVRPAAAGRLGRAGCRLAVPPESFFVSRDQPPPGEKRRHATEALEPGEVERAAAWARTLPATGAG